MFENGIWKKLLAEVVGTFILTSAIIFPSIALRDAGVGAFLFIMFTAGLGMAVVVWLFGNISGGHANPAVTFGAMITRKMTAMTGVLYWIAQLVGGILAAYYARGTFRVDTGSASELANYGTASATAGYKDAQIFMAEMLGTFILVAVVLAVMHMQDKVSKGIAIGGALLVAVVMTAPVSGGALNPAREFGPMIASGTFKSVDLMYYLVAPFVGALIAAIVYVALSDDGMKSFKGMVKMTSRKSSATSEEM